jgi:hypothetical protein
MKYLMKRHMMMKDKEQERDYNYRENDYRGDYRNDYRRDYNRSEYPSYYGYDHRGSDYRERDYRGYDYRGEEYRGQDYHSEEQLMSMYKQDLEKWTYKLKEKDRFKLSKEEVIKKAKNMGVAFMDYTENEFYVMYLLMLSLFKSVANEPHTYLAMAKSALEEPSSSLSPSEKVQVIMYEIAMGGKPSF